MAALGGALSELTKPYNWEQVGSMTPEEAAELFTSILLGYYNSSCASGEAPFWQDEETGDDADGEPEAAWYETASDWVIQAFLASTFSPGAAIVYEATIPKLRIALRKHDLGAAFKVFIDGLLLTEGDTYSATPAVANLNIDVAGFAAEHDLDPPYTLRIEHAGAPSGGGLGGLAGSDYRLEVIRDRLSAPDLNDVYTEAPDLEQLEADYLAAFGVPLEVPMTISRQDPTRRWRLEQSFDNGETWEMFADLSELCYCEDDDMQLRQNPDTPCILERKLSGDTVWTPFADLRLCQPANPKVNPPTPKPPESGTVDEKRCYMASNAVEFYSQYMISMGQQIDTFPGGATLVILFNGLGILQQLLYAIIPGSDWQAYISDAAIRAAVTENLINYPLANTWETALLIEESLKPVRCAIYDLVDEDGVIDFAALVVVLDALVIDNDVHPLTRDVIAALGQAGLNAALSGQLVEGGDCDCEEPPPYGDWCYTWDFTVDAYDWIINPIYGTEGRSWISGEGFVSVHNSGGGVGLNLDSYDDGFPADTNIVALKVDLAYTLSGLSYDLGMNWSTFASPNSSGVFDQTSGAGTGVTEYLEVDGIGNEVTRLFLSIGGPAGSGSVIAIRRVTIYGLGENPFGADNC